MARATKTTAQQREERGVQLGLRHAADIVEQHMSIGSMRLLAVGMAMTLRALADEPAALENIVTNAKKR